MRWNWEWLKIRIRNLSVTVPRAVVTAFTSLTAGFIKSRRANAAAAEPNKVRALAELKPLTLRRAGLPDEAQLYAALLAAGARHRNFDWRGLSASARR